jgi:hypothetical protein
MEIWKFEAVVEIWSCFDALMEIWSCFDAVVDTHKFGAVLEL